MIISLIKSIFSPKCHHEADMDNKESFQCKHCKMRLSGLVYSSGGIGKSDDYFSWQIRRDLEDPNSTTSQILKRSNIQERIKKVKEQIRLENLNSKIEK